MSYLTFLLIFLVLPVMGLIFVQPRPLGGVGGKRARFAIGAICFVALVYTTPWDNYLVYREVWEYGPERVIGTIGYVPIEEYLFFILQPLLTSLLLFLLLHRAEPREPSRVGVVVVGVVYAAASLAGVYLLVAGSPRMLYMGLILAWAAPVMLGLWIYAGRHLWRYRRTLLIAILVPSVYLWIADTIALHLGIWSISDLYSIGFDPLGLPIEEATFFLVTNMLVAQGALTFLHGEHLGAEEGREPKPVERTS